MEKPNEFMDKFLPATYWGKVHYLYVNILPLIIGTLIAGLVYTLFFRVLGLPDFISLILSGIALYFSLFRLSAFQSRLSDKIAEHYAIDDSQRQKIRNIYLVVFYILLSIIAVIFALAILNVN